MTKSKADRIKVTCEIETTVLSKGTLLMREHLGTFKVPKEYGGGTGSISTSVGTHIPLVEMPDGTYVGLDWEQIVSTAIDAWESTKKGCKK